MQISSKKNFSAGINFLKWALQEKSLRYWFLPNRSKGKWAVNSIEQEKWIIEKLRGSRSPMLHRLFVVEIPQNSQKFVSAPDTCGVTKYRPHHAVSFFIFWKIQKNLLLKAIKKAWWKWKILKKNDHVIYDSHYQIWK